MEQLRRFVEQMTRLIDTGAGENDLVDTGSRYMADLVADDSWLPDFCAEPHPQSYRQYLLHCDPLQRFSVASFVWGPGQKTPIHDHTVWGLVGVLRGAELERRFERRDGALVAGEAVRLNPGSVCKISTRDGDLHEVSNGFDDRVSISIHAYGANIGRVQRHVFDPTTGAEKSFVSGYSNTVLPNIWA